MDRRLRFALTVLAVFAYYRPPAQWTPLDLFPCLLAVPSRQQHSLGGGFPGYVLRTIVELYTPSTFTATNPLCYRFCLTLGTHMPRFEYRNLAPTPRAEKAFLQWIEQL